MKHTIREVNGEVVPDFKTCPKCGKQFPRIRNGVKAWMRKRFCSVACCGRLRDYGLPASKECVACHREFFRPVDRGATQWRKQICCSPECAHKLHGSHHLTETKEYRIWTNMKTRCLNPQSSDYRRYGGRGITVCASWKNDFVAFLRDMGTCPHGMSLDRIDNDLGYGPLNCRWSTAVEQSSNRSTNVRISIGGVTRTAKQWAVALGISYERARSLFGRDCSIMEIAPIFGFSVVRRARIEILDAEAVKAAGLMKECPDFAAIRRRLDFGAEVPGAQISGIEYVLRAAVPGDD